MAKGNSANQDKNSYAGHAEILAYLKRTVADHDLGKNVKLSHQVTEAKWEEDRARWKVTVTPVGKPEAAFVDYADVVINSTGVLNKWKWPNLKGLEKFKNKTHTAAWDHSLDLKDKVVGIIGNGSSSVQVTTATHPYVKNQVIFLRSATWVTPGFASKFVEIKDGITNPAYTDEDRKNFKEKPEEHLEYRKAVEAEMNSNFGIVIRDSPAANEAAAFARKEMLAGLAKKPELIEKLIPKDFSIGCRVRHTLSPFTPLFLYPTLLTEPKKQRPIPNHGYMQCLTSDKTEVTFSGIREVTEEGIITEDGKLHKLDILVCGTGFDVSYVALFPIYGTGNVNLQDQWKDSPECYLSVMVPNFPNYFTVIGPFGPYGHGSIIPAMEALTRHTALVIEKIQKQNIKSVQPKWEAVEEFKAHRVEYLKRTIWAAPCSAWFKLGPKGENIMMWPGSRLHTMEVLLNPRWEDYDYEYLYKNRYSYWGNGFTLDDAGGEGTDKAWYIAGI